MELDQKTLAAVQNSKWWCVTDKEVEEIVRAYLAALPTAGPAGTSGPVATSSAERFIISHGSVFSVGGGGVVASGGGTAMSSDPSPPSDPVRDAAPELLAALKEVLDHIPIGFIENPNVVERAIVALTKAGAIKP